MIAWLPLLTAHAQQEVCAPYPPDRLQAELAAAEQALLALQVQRGASLLDEVVRQARCLDAVVAPGDLARLARLQALRGFYEQDPEALAAWAQLAHQVDPLGPWPIDADHPVRRFVDPTLTPSSGGPSDAWVAHPRRGGLFLDGRWLERPEAAIGSPHLVQVFDANGTLVDGWWQDGSAFPDVALSTVPTETAPPRWVEDTPAAEISEALRGWGPARRDTAEAYAAYLRRHPTGEHAAEARRRLDTKEWEAAAEEGSVEAARAYLERWPEGAHVEQAEQVLEGEAFRQAVEAGTREALVLFRGRYPRGAYAAEANRRLDDLAWAEATGTDTPKAYERYRFHWPQGQHAREARLAQEELEWNAASAEGSREALARFLEAWPRGSHAEQATERLQGLRFSRVVLRVEGQGASAVSQRLRAHLRGLGFEVVEGGSGPGTALLHVQITGTGPLVGALELQAHGLSRPLASVRLKASEPDQLGAWLVDALPPLGRWKR